MDGFRKAGGKPFGLHELRPLQQVAVGHERGPCAAPWEWCAVPTTVIHRLDQREVLKLNTVRNIEIRYKSNQTIVDLSTATGLTREACGTASCIDHLPRRHLDIYAGLIKLKPPAAILISGAA